MTLLFSEKMDVAIWPGKLSIVPICHAQTHCLRPSSDLRASSERNGSHKIKTKQIFPDFRLLPPPHRDAHSQHAFVVSRLPCGYDMERKAVERRSDFVNVEIDRESR